MDNAKKGNRFFCLAMLIALSIHLLFAFLPHFLPDESFYATIPYRLYYGDSLVQDEWHLSQFSSFFTILPVSLWLTIKGSADGLILFLRLVYLAIHTGAAVVIYRLFCKKYGFWAVAAALIYYLQTPYKLYTISYHSMFALFLLLFSVCLYCIYQKKSKKLYVFAGVCYSACCIANPFFGLTILLYPIVFCFGYSVRDREEQQGKPRTALSTRDSTKTDGLKGKSSKERFGSAGYACVFSKQAILYFLLGAASIVAAWLVFFFGTGGTVSSVVNNLPNMLDSTEYDIISKTIVTRFTRIASAVRKVSFNQPYLFLLLFISLLIDKKRKKNSHRMLYLAITVLVSVVCIIGMRSSLSTRVMFFSLPLFLLSVVCYILTERKNTPLFLCMWCPCAAAALIDLFTANTILSAAGIVLAVSNATGIVFAHDLFFELSADLKTTGRTQSARDEKRWICRISRIIICAGICLQTLFYLYIIQFGQPITSNLIVADNGPYSGILMNKDQYTEYCSLLNDLDYILQHSSEEDPVLIVSCQSWFYLYLRHPIATYTTWFDRCLNVDALNSYYQSNPDKIPKKIYITYLDIAHASKIHYFNVNACMDTINQMFDCEQEELTKGILLTVSEYRYD